MKKYWFILLLVLTGVGFLALAIGQAAVSPETTVPAQNETPMATPVPVESETPTATFGSGEESATTAAPTQDWAEMRIYRQTSTAPDGQWTAEFIMAFPEEDTYEEDAYGEGSLPLFYTGLIVRSTDGNKEWRIIDEWAEEGLGISYPRPLLWSKDGRSFYYTNDVVPDGCGGALKNGSDLYKVDLESGKVTQVLESGQTWLAISPDEQTVAYAEPYGRGLVLRDLASGEERSVSIGTTDRKQTYDVKIIWSPEGTALAVTIAIGACDMVKDGESTSILVVEADSLKVTPVLLEDKRYLTADEWIGNAQLLLSDPQKNQWRWDREKGELTFLGTAVATPPCAPTETPTATP